VPSGRGQVTVLVDERVAEQAHRVLGTKPTDVKPPSVFARFSVLLLVAALVFGIVVGLLAIATR
jgi:hypothetical protein